MLRHHGRPEEVVTDRAAPLRAAVEDLVPSACHNTAQYANNRIEADHGRLKSRLRPMQGLNRDRQAGVVIAGHAFVQSVRREHYEIGIHASPRLRLAAAFAELAVCL